MPQAPTTMERARHAVVMAEKTVHLMETTPEVDSMASVSAALNSMEELIAANIAAMTIQQKRHQRK